MAAIIKSGKGSLGLRLNKILPYNLRLWAEGLFLFNFFFYLRLFSFCLEVYLSTFLLLSQEFVQPQIDILDSVRNNSLILSKIKKALPQPSPVGVHLKWRSTVLPIIVRAP